MEVMTNEVLEKCIKDHFKVTGSGLVTFSWHGGEPLLAGLKFFRKVVSLQKKYARKDVTVLNGIQTNGTLIDEEWCRFLSKEKFMIGLSLDGPEKLHDIHRKSSNGQPSFERVMIGFKMMKEHGIIPEILCVVNSENVNHPEEIYCFFKSLGVSSITFLPLVERIPGTNKVSGRSVPSEKFGIFLSTVFDEWLEKDIGNIKIQVFEEAARTAFKQDHTLCIFKENCGLVPVIEHTGDFFACDHFVEMDFLRGNIKERSLAEMLDSAEQVSFGNNKSASLPRCCKTCEVLEMCNGECPKNRFLVTPDGEQGLNYLCAGYKYFFNHCKPFVKAVGSMWNK